MCSKRRKRWNVLRTEIVFNILPWYYAFSIHHCYVTVRANKETNHQTNLCSSMFWLVWQGPGCLSRWQWQMSHSQYACQRKLSKVSICYRWCTLSNRRNVIIVLVYDRANLRVWHVHGKRTYEKKLCVKVWLKNF